jgi:CheY-like chemotaxis protein
VDILWVETHAVFARLAARQFLAEHTVTIVPTLAAARAALAARFDVVLIDYDLDDGKGDELVRWLTEEPTRPRIVAASSHEAGNRALHEAGADVVCGKMAFVRIGDVLAGLAREDDGVRGG